MVTMSQLWLPVLLSAIAVFAVSSVIHMASPWHKSDYPRMSNEDAVMDALRPLAIPPGDYFFPRPTGTADMKSPEFGEKMRKGPVIVMTVMPNGPVTMTRSFIGWFLYTIAVSFVTALVAVVLPVGARPALVFHETALLSFAGYALALWQLSIWYRRAVSITIKSTVDGAIYAVLTGAIFAWLWPR